MKKQKIILGHMNRYGNGHLWLLLTWPLYFVSYFMTERFVSPNRCISMHCALDNAIPFCELFVIPYLSWYLLIIFSLAYFLLWDKDSFKKLQSYIIILQLIATVIYIILPTKQELRPESFLRSNIFIRLILWIYTKDTNTGVSPSLHCAISIAIASVWIKKKDASKLSKGCILVLCTLICLSTCFIKQHSLLDFITAIPVCLISEFLVFHTLFPNTEKPLSKTDI